MIIHDPHLGLLAHLLFLIAKTIGKVKKPEKMEEKPGAVESR